MSAINLHPATPEQKTVLANLIQLYLYDMTEFMPFPVGGDGRFETNTSTGSGGIPTSSCLATRSLASR